MTVNLPVMVNQGGELVRKGRVSPALATAIRLIVEQGLTIAEAAAKTEYKRESLAKAMIKPHVRAYRDGVKRAWLTSKAAKAWVTVAELAEGAQSEKVQLDAAKTILTAMGELAGDDDNANRQAGALIQIIRNETHIHGQSLSQRLPGVMEAQEYQEADFQPLDRDPSLTPSEEP